MLSDLGISARILLRGIRAYQRVVDGRPTPCRYVPTCSNYALDALEGHGAIRGVVLTLRRLARCHPWGGQGWDPVPRPGDEPASPHLDSEPAQKPEMGTPCST